MKKFLRTIFFIAFFFFALPCMYAQTPITYINGQTTLPIDFPGGCIYSWTNDNPAIGLQKEGGGTIPSFTAINNGNTPIMAHIIATPQLTSFAYVPVSIQDRGGVAVIDVNTGLIGTTIKLGTEPTDAEVNHAGTAVFICDHDASQIVAVNTMTNQDPTMIPLISKPLSCILSPDDSKLYVCDFPYITVINISNNSITNIPDLNPASLAVSPDGTRLYVATTGTTGYVLNTSTYTQMAGFTAGSNASNMSISPDGSKLYLQNNNSIDVVSTVNYGIVGNIPTGLFPGKVIYNKAGDRAYVTSQNPSSISIINAATSIVINYIPLNGQQPSGLCLTPDGNYLYSVNATENAIEVVSLATNTTISYIKELQNPISIGNFITPYVKCGGDPINITITVDPTPPPTIVAGNVTGNIFACVGSASVSPAIEQFNVSGSYLLGNITAAAPSGFEISLNSTGGYGNSLTLNQTGGTVAGTTIYVRSSASAPAGNNIMDKVKLSTTSGTDQSPVVSETISEIPIVNAVTSQTLLNGATTTPVTFTGMADTYSWINDTPGIGLAANGTGNIPAFTAINNTFGPIKATITVTPVNSSDCDGTPVTFTITVNATRIATITAKDIPNTFTPNGDGRNDTWVINNIGYFPRSTVNIFNRWGQKLFSSVGYPIPWDGTHNGKALTTGTYYYIIDLKNGQKVIAGEVYIIK